MNLSYIVKDVQDMLYDDKLYYVRNHETELYDIYENGKKIWYIGYGKLVNITSTYVVMDLSDHNTINTIIYLKDFFEDVSDVHLIGFLFKNQNLQIDYELNKVYKFVYSFDIMITCTFASRLKFKICDVLLDSDEEVHLKYIKLYRLLRKKKMTEIVYHPDNINFELT